MVDRRSFLAGVTAGSLLIASAPGTSSAAAAARKVQPMATPRATPGAQATPGTGAPTIVLVHGAWADGASWSGVIGGLSGDGLTVVAPANPLRSLLSDADDLASFLASIEGPVLLVGHSYGGAVMSIAAASASNVVGLVYVAAYALEIGETLLDIANQFPVETLNQALRQVPISGGTADAPAVDVYLDRALLPSVFAADVDPAMQTILAATERPIAFAAFGEPAPAAAWTSLPSWALVATADMALGPAVPFMAQRAGSTVTEIDSSHALPVSHPEAVVEVIRTAVASLA